jgi:putative transposase
MVLASGSDMPRRRRIVQPGIVFHVINRSARRGGLFESTADYQLFEQLLVDACRRFRIALLAYCLMPNHWHLLLSPSSSIALSRFMHWLTTTHARRWRLAQGTSGQGAVYQGRFRAIPVGDDAHFLVVCRYVERNALRAALVDRAEAWPWSSLWQRERDPNVAWLAPWPVPRPVDWTARINEPQTAAEVEAVRRATATGEPFGNPEWAAAMTRALGLNRPARRGVSSKKDSRPPSSL